MTGPQRNSWAELGVAVEIHRRQVEATPDFVHEVRAGIPSPGLEEKVA